MSQLKHTATQDTPAVLFDTQQGIFEITERSFPENAVAFYTPLITALKEYAAKPVAKTIFTFKLDYYNTSTAKEFLKIFWILEDITKKSEVLVKWYYAKDDVDMQAAGDRFAQLTALKFELVGY